MSENTLTAPEDRDPNKTFKLDQSAPPLNDEQTQIAVSNLNNTSFVERFSEVPQIERRYADPPVDYQKIGLISFVPAKGATPNENGIYGFAKLRGNYPSEHEANERAEWLIRNADSYHQIYHTFVGRPFPLTCSSDYSKNVDRVDLQQETSNAIREDVRQKREREQREIEEIKEREKELLEDVKKEEEDLDDHYTTLRVKKAQLVWTYVETKKKMEQMVGLIAKTKYELDELDKKEPNLKQVYYQKYVDARKKAGLPTDNTSLEQSFVKYMVEDIQLPEIEEEYRRMFCESD